MRFVLSLIICIGLVLPAGAVQPDEVLDDPALEARARGLSAQLRCLVCQNQSIDDSDAPLAKDLRLLVRERLVAGDSDTQVKDFVVARYGEFVLLNPKFGAHTLLLWGLPFVILLAGAILVYRRRGATSPAAPEGLSKEEKAKIDKLLKG